ncbi:unnamed protein product, partial [Allacma fusca]
MNPKIDEEDILRVQSRIERSPDLSQDQKSPIILDPSNSYTKLLLANFHLDVHQGKEKVLNRVRQQYWVHQGRKAVKSTWSRCIRCKIDRAQPFVPMMGVLPQVRVTCTVKPFVYTGMDYFGPISITKGRHHEKRYGVLFPCLSTRAVHVEIAGSLTTDSCICALRRFMARSCHVSEIYSDNRANLRVAYNELAGEIKSLDSEKIAEFLVKRKTDWHLTLKELHPKDETLQTFMAEAEYNCVGNDFEPRDLLLKVSTQPLYPAVAVSSGELDPSNECTIKIGKVQSDGTSERTLREVKVQPLNPVGTVNSGERIPGAFTQVPHKGLVPRTAGRISQVEVPPVNPVGAVNTGESIPAFTQVALEQASVVVNSQLLPVNVENNSSALGE